MQSKSLRRFFCYHWRMYEHKPTEEQYDILDEHGNKTGEVLPKSIVHDKELLHGSVFIWIYNSKSEVLLQLRAKDKKSFPGVWDVSVAGHISAGDKPIETAVREIEEEIGVKVSPHELKQVDFVADAGRWLPSKIHPEMCWVFILHKELDPHKLNIQKEELTAIKLQLLSDIEIARKKPNGNKEYAARNSRIYDTAFDEIKTILSR